MQRTLLLGKIHRATVTEADVNYEGSFTIDKSLLDAAGMVEYEQVHVWNITQATRLSTYLLCGPAGSGVVCANGAAAHLNKPGDIVILATFGQMDEQAARVYQPKVVHVNAQNQIARLA